MCKNNTIMKLHGLIAAVLLFIAGIGIFILFARFEQRLKDDSNTKKGIK